jgi:hypothetical protein
MMTHTESTGRRCFGGKLVDHMRNEQATRHMKKTGRNDPCPCGSGKKFKKCHGDAGVVSPPIAAALKAYFEESQKIESQTFETIGSGLGELVGELRAFDRISCVTAIAALQSIAENRNCRNSLLRHTPGGRTIARSLAQSIPGRFPFVPSRRSS